MAKGASLARVSFRSVTFDMWVLGHSRSLKVILFSRGIMVIVVVYGTVPPALTGAATARKAV